MSGLLEDLEPKELVMLGHVLRMTPANACLTDKSAADLAGRSFVMFTEVPAYKTLWSKVAAAISQRDDVAPYRVTRHD